MGSSKEAQECSSSSSSSLERTREDGILTCNWRSCVPFAPFCFVFFYHELVVPLLGWLGFGRFIVLLFPTNHGLVAGLLGAGVLGAGDAGQVRTYCICIMQD